MTDTGNAKSPSRKWSQNRVQSLILILLIVLPFLTYLAAQSGLPFLINGLIGLMALIMIITIWLC